MKFVEKTTGTLWAINKDNVLHLALFFSKQHASTALSKLPERERINFAVRGMTQLGLRFYLLVTYMWGQKMCIFDPFAADIDEPFSIVVDQKKVARDYYYRDPPLKDDDFKERFR